MTPTTDGPVMANFLAKVDVSQSDCWFWRATISEWGYGQFWANKKTQRAHRVAFQTFRGPIPRELELDRVQYVNNGYGVQERLCRLCRCETDRKRRKRKARGE